MRLRLVANLGSRFTVPEVVVPESLAIGLASVDLAELLVDKAPHAAWDEPTTHGAVDYLHVVPRLLQVGPRTP